MSIQGAKDVAVWLDANDRAKDLQAFLQLISVVTIGLHPIIPSFVSPTNADSYQTYSLCAALVSTFLVLLASVLVLLFKRQYGLNILVYREDEGILYDKRRKFHNVALRRETVRRLLRGIREEGADRKTILETVGRDIGSGYANQMSEFQVAVAGDKGKALLERLLKYDQSSGMGVFNISRVALDHNPSVIIVSVRNSFVDTDSSSSPSTVEFLGGYLAGICSNAFKKTFQSRGSSVSTEGDTIEVRLEAQ